MRDKYVIGLDYGTLSGRGVLVRCKDGKIAYSAQMDYRHGVMEKCIPEGTELSTEWCLQHPGDYIEVLEYVVSEIVKKGAVESRDIIGIGVDFTASTVMPIDESGQPLCLKDEFKNRRNAYVKVWKHHGAQEQANQINQLLEERKWIGAPRFGSAISSELLVPKVLEMIKEDPEVYDRAAEIVEAGDWITRVLTGSNDRSCSMAGYKAWWNIKEGYPDNDFFTALDSKLDSFVIKKLPGEIKSMGECIGKLTKDYAKRFGLEAGISIAPAIIDSHAGVPGSGVSKQGQVMLVLGTSSVMIALSKKAYSEKGICGGVKSGIVPGLYALESGLAAVGDLFGWFINNCLPMSYYEEAKGKSIDIFTHLNSKAEKLKIGESGLLALDWWNGNKTPFVDGQLSGTIVGLTLKTKPEEIYRTLIEATAFETRTIMELYIKAGVEIDEIVASGGISYKNPMLMQIYADVLGKDIKIAQSDQAAALGSAIYASLAAGKECGGYDLYQEAVEHMSKIKEKKYYSSLNNNKKYDKLYKIYEKFGYIMGEENREIIYELHTLEVSEE